MVVGGTAPVRLTPRRFLAHSLLAFGLVSGGGGVDVARASIDSTLQDQLKVLQLLQVEGSGESSQRNTPPPQVSAETVLARVSVALPSPGGSVDAPVRYTRAAELDQSFSGDKACLFVTASGADGAPLAAKKFIELGSVSFPLVFDLTTNDLLFPYNQGIYLKSKAAKSSLAVAAILDEDCKLATNSDISRFGFAFADIKPLDTFQTIERGAVWLEDGPTSNTGMKLTPRSDGLLRTEAAVTVRLRSDGKAYNQQELDILSRIDSQLQQQQR